jgi:hypothetical protein
MADLIVAQPFPKSSEEKMSSYRCDGREGSSSRLVSVPYQIVSEWPNGTTPRAIHKLEITCALCGALPFASYVRAPGFNQFRLCLEHFRELSEPEPADDRRERAHTAFNALFNHRPRILEGSGGAIALQIGEAGRAA